MRRCLGAVAALALLAGCGDKRPATPVAAPPERPARVPDSLALQLRVGLAVWFTDSRSATDSTGRPCLERVMEIRRDSSVIRIPLLYTGERPVRINDSVIEVPIWLHCRPGNVYRVNLRTGQPVRVR